MDTISEDLDSIYESRSEINISSLPDYVPSSFISEISEIELRSGLTELPTSINETPEKENEIKENSLNESLLENSFSKHSSYNDEMLNLAKQITRNEFIKDKNSQASVWITPTSQPNSVSGSQPRRKRNKKTKPINDEPEFSKPSFFGDDKIVVMQTRTRTIKKSHKYQYFEEQKNKKQRKRRNTITLPAAPDIDLKLPLKEKSKKLYNGTVDYLEELSQNPVFSISLSTESLTNNTKGNQMDLFDKVRLSQYSNPVRSGPVHYLSSLSSDDNENKNIHHTNVSLSSDNKNLSSDIQLKDINYTISTEERKRVLQNPNTFVPCDNCKQACIAYVNRIMVDVKSIISHSFDFCPIADRLQVYQDLNDFIVAKKAKYNLEG